MIKTFKSWCIWLWKVFIAFCVFYARKGLLTNQEKKDLFKDIV